MNAGESCRLETSRHSRMQSAPIRLASYSKHNPAEPFDAPKSVSGLEAMNQGLRRTYSAALASDSHAKD